MTEDIQLYEKSSQPAPDNVRVTDYRVMPWPDGTRVTVEFGLTPFRQFPALDVSVTTLDGQVLRAASVVGAMERRPAPTLHLPRLERGTALVALIELLDGESVTQQVTVPFEVGGPIVRQVLSE